MTGFDVSAPLFAIAARFVGVDKVRHYLHGVQIEPHPAGGALLVATDGHRLLCAHDETGTADRPAIIQLDRPQLAIARGKPGQGYTDRRLRGTYAETDPSRRTRVEIVDVADETGDGSVVGAASDVEIAGDYPDWRRIIPREPVTAPGLNDFDGDYLADFVAAGAAYRKAFTHGKGAGPMTVAAANTGDPAFVRWGGVENMFGILMPMRRSSKPEAVELPRFMFTRPAAQDEAA